MICLRLELVTCHGRDNDGFTPSQTERNKSILKNNAQIILDTAQEMESTDA